MIPSISCTLGDTSVLHVYSRTIFFNARSDTSAFIMKLVQQTNKRTQIIHTYLHGSFRVNYCHVKQNEAQSLLYRMSRAGWVARQRPRPILCQGCTCWVPWHLQLKLLLSKNGGLHRSSCHPIWDVSASGLSCTRLADFLPPWQ